MSFAPIKHGKLYYEETGSGFPLLLIHAGIANHRMWDEQAVEFSKFYRVVRYDYRGFGLSQTESVEYSNRQDILDLLDHLGIEKTALLGISLGGQIALDFTVEHPERVAALVMVAAGIGGYNQEPDGTPKSQLEAETFTKMDELWEKGDVEALNAEEVRFWVDGPGQPEGRAPDAVRKRVLEMNRTNYHRADGEPNHIRLEPPAVGRLAEVSVPVLILVGDLDTTGTLAMADVMVQKIPGARKIVFNGAAHMLNMEMPERFNREVLDFLSGCRPGS